MFENQVLQFQQGTEYWGPSKRFVSEASFPEKLCNMDINEISKDVIDQVNVNFLSHPEWDPVGAGKVTPLAEILGKWVVAIKVSTKNMTTIPSIIYAPIYDFRNTTTRKRT